MSERNPDAEPGNPAGTTPPVPPPGTFPPPEPSPARAPDQPRRDDPLDGYHTAAETVGFMPSLRLKDNLFQIACVVVGVIIGAVVGAVFITGNGGIPLAAAAAIGAILGLIAGGLLSGFVLMILGWVRAAKKLGSK